MNSTIKPIETIYNGYRFRSRLEARWAVFFDALNLKYEYEPEGYALENGMKYLPDFVVYGVKGRADGYAPERPLFVEVKGAWTHEDIEKVQAFKEKLLCVGQIPQTYDDACNQFFETDGLNFSAQMIDGDEYPIAWCADEKGNVALYGVDNLTESYAYENVENAYKKARQARFEHGETPT